MSSTSDTPETAVQRAAEAQQGDRSAFEWLVRRYRNLVASIAYSHIGDFGRSEDIAQQTFLTAWERLATLEDTHTIVSWLAGIARNLARNEARRAHHRSEYSSDSTEERVLQREDYHSEPPEAIVMRREQEELLWNMLEKLPVNYREPLVLYYREGNSVAEVATQLELSPDSVKQRLSRGRNMLRAELMDVLEETLRETEPSEAFVGSVMSALPVSTVLAAGGSASIAKGVQYLFLKKLFGGTIMTGALGGILGGLVGAMGGAFGAWWGTKKSLDAATSQQERSAIKQLAVYVTFLALAFAGLQVAIAYFLRGQYLAIAITVGCISYVIPLALLIVRYNRRIREIKSEHGTEEERAAGGYALSKVEPASTKASRWNSLGAIVGSSAWLVILAAINQDYWTAAIMLAIVVLLCNLAWKWAQNTDTVSQQLRNNATLMIPLILAQALAVGLRWNSWPSQSLGTGLAYEGWLISAAILVLGLTILGLIWANSVAVSHREQASESSS